MSNDTVVNVDWTLESMKKTKSEGDYIKETCYSCAAENVEVKVYTIAVLNTKLAWQDGMSPVYEKIKAHYCDDCADELIKTFEEEEVASE